MKRRHLRRPSPALVIACVALFVALGGTVMAATKIDGAKIRVGSLPGNRLTIRSLPGNRLVPGSIKGTQVDTGSLAEVPSAAHADSADTAHRAQTAAAADHASDASAINGRTVGCTEGAREFAGACWDLRARTTALTAPEAAAACAAAGGELPMALAMKAFSEQPGVLVSTGGEWLNQLSVSSETQYSVYLFGSDGFFHLRVPTELHQFRCVTPLLH